MAPPHAFILDSFICAPCAPQTINMSSLFSFEITTPYSRFNLPAYLNLDGGGALSGLLSESELDT